MPGEPQQPEMGLSKKLFLAIVFSLPAMVFAGFMVWNAWRRSDLRTRTGRREPAEPVETLAPAARAKLEAELAKATTRLAETRKDLLQAVARLQMLRVQSPEENPGLRGEISGLEHQVRGLKLNEANLRAKIDDLEKRLKTGRSETTDVSGEAPRTPPD
ncbi:MAG: hypothetical protein ACYTGB_06425 [Planctomycetota bacterium]|jgi:septal ring factor EnvC (AmiA/AmiB activator)